MIEELIIHLKQRGESLRKIIGILVLTLVLTVIHYVFTQRLTDTLWVGLFVLIVLIIREFITGQLRKKKENEK